MNLDTLLLSSLMKKMVKIIKCKRRVSCYKPLTAGNRENLSRRYEQIEKQFSNENDELRQVQI